MIIGFDIQPGTSGPGRYVASLIQGIQASGWEYITPCETNQSNIHTTPAIRPGAVRSTLSNIARRLPRQMRLCAGHVRDIVVKARQLRSHLCDIFHAQNTGCEEIPIAARHAGFKRVLGTFHVDSTCDLDRERSGIVHRTLEWFSNRALHKAIAVSEATRRDWIRRTGMAESRVVTIHNGIDPERFQRQEVQNTAKRKLGLPADSIIIGAVGRLSTAKGFSYLIEAVSLLRSSYPHIMVALAGTGPSRSQLEDLASRLAVSDRVVFLGFRLDINEVLDACDVFVMPSLSETLGYALLEAMAHSLPTIGTAVGGIPEVILPMETGLLVPPRDPVGLATAIKLLLDSSDLRERLGRAARERVINHFHEADMVRKTIAVYRDMLPKDSR